jgi:hypothetical protein
MNEEKKRLWMLFVVFIILLLFPRLWWKSGQDTPLDHVSLISPTPLQPCSSGDTPNVCSLFEEYFAWRLLGLPDACGGPLDVVRQEGSVRVSSLKVAWTSYPSYGRRHQWEFLSWHISACYPNERPCSLGIASKGRIHTLRSICWRLHAPCKRLAHMLWYWKPSLTN